MRNANKNRIGVVIATRNRPTLVKNLLTSIKINSLKPKVISVVSSGENIEPVVREFSNKLQIIYEHTSLTGQVTQRNLGISRIINDLDYLVFLDDDIELPQDFFQSVFDFISLEKNKYQGIGIKILNLPNSQNRLKKIQKLFYEWSDTPGSVLPSGVATEYNFCKKITEVSWLRGISIWETSVLKKFKHSELPGEYAALEDLIYSYQVGLEHRLVFHPGIAVTLKDTIETKKNILNRTNLANQNRYFFVKKIMQKKSIYFYFNLLGKIFAQTFFLLFYMNKKINSLILFGHIRFLIYSMLFNRGN